MRDAVRVWQRQRLEDAERLNAMRARIRRSLDDPRPSLAEEEAEADMDRFMKGQEKASSNEARQGRLPARGAWRPSPNLSQHCGYQSEQRHCQSLR